MWFRGLAAMPGACTLRRLAAIPDVRALHRFPTAQDRPMTASVQHEPQQQRFTVVVDGVQALLEYQMRDDQLVITHTGVPEAIGGRGVASNLVKAAFEYARSSGYKVHPACSYAAAWSERHPEYSQLLA
jgi:predicted GNAT family acetyltransferase